MTRRTWVILLGSLMIVCFCATQASADQKKKVSGYHAYSGNEIVDHALAYSFADERLPAQRGEFDLSQISPGKIPVGTIFSAGGAASPGVVVGNTWYDFQHNCTMGRMIGCGPHSGEAGYTVVHMGWMYLPDEFSLGVYRSYAYSAYFSYEDSLVGPVYLAVPGEDYMGYVNVDVTPDNRAIVGGHNNPVSLAEGYSPEFYYDDGPGEGNFPTVERVPYWLKTMGQFTSIDCCWPKFFFQFGSDTVMHVAAEMSEPEGIDEAAMIYFRKVGFEGSPYGWDYPPYAVDTVYDISQDITGERYGDRVCLVWFAALPYTATPYVPGCDTCSGISPYEGDLVSQMDNDVYYQESIDQGATWLPRVNITQSVIGAAGDKAYCDASVLFDSGDNLHIIWGAVPWAADLCLESGGSCWSEDWFVKNARLLHWSENVPYIREITNQVYDVDPVYRLIDSCRAGAWNNNIAKPSLSECDGRLYALWTQFNNPREGIVDDCAQWSLDLPNGSDREGGANGELWVSISSDWGATWDYQRNLTNSYTPACDPVFAENCQSDHWASMSRIGRAIQTGENWGTAVVVDPSGGEYSGDHYLDIMYVNDLDAGGVIMPEGTWTNNPIKWFRMLCVDPAPAPVFTVEWTHLGEPATVLPGDYLDTTLIIENNGNATLTYSMEVVYDSGAPGWLGTSGFTGTVPAGLGNTESGSLRLNQLLWRDTTDCFAHLHFTGNDPNNLPADVYIDLIIVDTIIPLPFSPSVDYEAGLYPSSVFSIDLDGDGDRDLAVANSDSDDISILLNNSDGTFVSPVHYPVNDLPTSVYGADLDGDGDNDLAVANSGSDNASVLMNHGDATFEGAVDYGVGTGARAVCLTDCDCDGDWDMVVANSDDDDVSILLNYSDGTFATAVDYLVGDYPVSVCAADFDGDTDKDVATANYYANTVSVMKNNGDATFEGAVDYGVGTGPSCVVTCDLDGDGDYDLAVANSDSDDISILMNDANATFATAINYPVGDGPSSIYVGDVDGDGAEDLVVANQYSDSVSVLTNRGDGTFEGAVDYGVGTGPSAICLTDCDGDGDYDIVTANCESDDVSILFNETDEPVICCEARGDFNRDGTFDILDIDDFINHLFQEGAPPVCEDEVDVDDSGRLNILDIDRLIDYYFRDGPELVPCP